MLKLLFIVSSFIENLKLEEHAKKHSKKLSGGTKRKVCTVILKIHVFGQVFLVNVMSSHIFKKNLSYIQGKKVSFNRKLMNFKNLK